MDIFKPFDDLISRWKAEQIQAEKEMLKTQAEMEKLQNRGDLLTAILITVLIVSVIVGQSILNSPKQLISKRIVAAGYTVDNLTIEKTSINGVYKASIPVISEDGQLIEMWEVQPIPGFQTIWGATPYPAQSIEKHKIIDLSFTPEEYERLLSLAQQNGGSLEDLIRKQVLQESVSSED